MDEITLRQMDYFIKQFVFFVHLVVSIDCIVKAITFVDVLWLLKLRACLYIYCSVCYLNSHVAFWLKVNNL